MAQAKHVYVKTASQDGFQFLIGNYRSDSFCDDVSLFLFVLMTSEWDTLPNIFTTCIYLLKSDPLLYYLCIFMRHRQNWQTIPLTQCVLLSLGVHFLHYRSSWSTVKNNPFVNWGFIFNFSHIRTYRESYVSDQRMGNEFYL